MADWFEDLLLLSLLNFMPISPYNRGLTRRSYYEHKRSAKDKLRSVQTWASAEYKKLAKNRLLRKYMRKYSKGRLISRDQRIFGGQILAAEAFKWDMRQARASRNI